jgi:hypothetical protein
MNNLGTEIDEKERSELGSMREFAWFKERGVEELSSMFQESDV